MASEIGSVALDVSAGTATLTTKSGVYFLNRAMDFINANMHKAFEEIENIGAPLQNLQLYSVFIDSAPIGNLPGMMGVIFYYYDIYDEVWLLFYEDLVYWNVEVRVDGETQQPEPLEQSEGMEAPAEEEEFEETGESAEPEIFDSGGLIAFYDCPYDLTINVGENFSKVEIWHYNSEGDIFKYGGWQSWLKVNDSLVYEWLEFEEGVDSVWYDHTQDENFYGKDDPDDFTDVTDYIYPGENTITFYHYNEGDGSGMVIKVYY